MFPLLLITDDILLGASRTAIFHGRGIRAGLVSSDQFLSSAVPPGASVYLICQSIPVEKAIAIAERQVRVQPDAEIVRLRHPEDLDDLAFGTILLCPITPVRLLGAVQAALQKVEQRARKPLIPPAGGMQWPEAQSVLC